MASRLTKRASDDVPEDVQVDPELLPDGRATVDDLVRTAKRKGNATPIRRTFVQRADRARRAEGAPLAELVRRRDTRALVLYLLVLTRISNGKDGWNVRRDSRMWARALDLSDTRSGREAVSKAWRRLRELRLISTHREKREVCVTLLREDGSGEPYDYPEPKKAEDRYLRLPLAFWLDGWYQKLDLPAMAMLLIFLAEKDDVVLQLDRVPEWYGISRATAQRGITQLEHHGLLDVRAVQRITPQSALGYTFERHYRLAGAFERAVPVGQATAATEPERISPGKRRRQRRKQATNRKEVI